MTRSEKLTPITQLASNREQDAAREMGRVQQLILEHENRLLELQAYRDEYLERMRRMGEDGIDATRLNDYRNFIRKLDEAISFQARQIEQCRSQLTVKQQQWQALRSQSKALDKVVDRYRSEEQRLRDRREQQESDERAQYNRRPLDP